MWAHFYLVVIIIIMKVWICFFYLTISTICAKIYLDDRGELNFFLLS
jgi:hypothetical protein